MGRVAGGDGDRAGLAPAVAQLRDGRLRDPRRGHRRRRPRTTRSSSRVIGDIAAGAAPDVTVAPGTAARIATGAPPPGRRRRGRPGRGDDAARRAGSAGPARTRRDRARPDGRSWSTSGRAGPRLDPFGAAATSGPGRRLLEAGTALTAAPSTLVRRARASPRSSSTAGRGSPCWRPATRSVPPGEPLGPAGIPDANGPGLRALVTAAGGEPIDLRIATDTLDDVLGAPPSRAGQGRRRADRVGRRVGRAVRRRQGRVRGDRPDRHVARRGPARQALRVRHRESPGRRASGPALRPARQPGLVCGDLRAVRPARDPRAWPGATTCSDRRIGPSWPIPSPRATAGGRSCASKRSATRPAAPIRDERGRVRVTPLAGGQGSHVISALAVGRCPGGHPGSPRQRCRPARRSRCGGSTAADDGHDRVPTATPAARPADHPEEPMDPRPQPRAERRRLTHVDRAGRPRMVDVSRQAGHRAAGRRRGDGRGLAGDDEPRHRWRRLEGRRPRRGRAGRASWAASGRAT